MFDRIRKFYAQNKVILNRSRYIYNFFVIPIYLLFGIVDLSVLFILLLVDSRKFLYFSLAMFLFLIALSIAVFCVSPFIKKKERQEEIDRLNAFFNQKLDKNPNLDYVLPNPRKAENIPVKFSKEGIYIGKDLHPYSDFNVSVFTSNYQSHVQLIAMFQKIKVNETDAQEFFDEGDPRKLTAFTLPIDIGLLSIIDKFNIELTNKDVLNFIKNNPDIATKQILKYGKLQQDYDKYKTK